MHVNADPQIRVHKIARNSKQAQELSRWRPDAAPRPALHPQVSDAKRRRSCQSRLRRPARRAPRPMPRREQRRAVGFARGHLSPRSSCCGAVHEGHRAKGWAKQLRASMPTDRSGILLDGVASAASSLHVAVTAAMAPRVAPNWREADFCCPESPNRCGEIWSLRQAWAQPVEACRCKEALASLRPRKKILCCRPSTVWGAG